MALISRMFETLILIALLCQMATGSQATSRQIIINEDDIYDTCTHDCGNMPVKYDFNDCTRLHSCKHSRDGWIRGFVDCDFCECTCDLPSNAKKPVEVLGKLSTNEDELYGTCTGTCDKRGLVRTNFKGWQEVSNCAYAGSGWIRGFVSCNLCTCDGKNYKYPKNSTLKDINYDFSRVELQALDEVTSIERATVRNCAKVAQSVSISIGYVESIWTSITSSATIDKETALTVTAETGFEEFGLSVKLSYSLQTTIKTGWTTTKGTTQIITDSHTATQTVHVSPGMSQDAYLVSNRQKIDLPYNATLVTEYSDGSTKEEPTQGTLSELGFSGWQFVFPSTVNLPSGSTDGQGNICDGTKAITRNSAEDDKKKSTTESTITRSSPEDDKNKTTESANTSSSDEEDEKRSYTREKLQDDPKSIDNLLVTTSSGQRKSSQLKCSMLCPVLMFTMATFSMVSF